jgi:hypothetical protein
MYVILLCSPEYFLQIFCEYHSIQDYLTAWAKSAFLLSAVTFYFRIYNVFVDIYIYVHCCLLAVR